MSVKNKCRWYKTEQLRVVSHEALEEDREPLKLGSRSMGAGNVIPIRRIGNPRAPRSRVNGDDVPARQGRRTKLSSAGRD